MLLAASPFDRDPLAIALEFDSVRDAVRSASFGDEFDVQQSHSTQIAEVGNELKTMRPRIVHFSGHGLETGELVFETEDGSSQQVAPEALRTVFAEFTDHVRLVVLNACWSEVQAFELVAIIDNVVGMTSRISDRAALQFSRRFYANLADGVSVTESFEQARCGLADEHETPRLLVRPGAGEVVVVGALGSRLAMASGEPGSDERLELVALLFKALFGPLVRLAATLLDDTPGAEAIVKRAFNDLLFETGPVAPGIEAAYLRSRVITASRAIVASRGRPTPSTPPGMSQDRVAVLRALADLADPQTEVLMLRHLGAVADAEVAIVVGRTEVEMTTIATYAMSALVPVLDRVTVGRPG